MRAELLKSQTSDSTPLLSRIACSAAWSCIGAACLRVFNLAAWVFCGRSLGKVAFGELSMIMSTAGALGILAGMGLGLTATRYVAEYRQLEAARAGRVLGLVLLIASLSGAFMAVLALVLARAMATSLLMAPQLTTALRIAVLYVWMSAVNGCQTGALGGFESFRALAFVNVWSGSASFVLVALCARYGGLEGAVWGLAMAQVLNCVLNHVALRRECARNRVALSIAGGWRELPILWRSALPALLSSALLLPALWICNACLVRQPAGYAELGLYAAADRWRLVILFVPSAVAGTVLPILSNLRGGGDPDGFRTVFQLSVRTNLVLALVPGVAVAVLAKPLITVFGSAYASGWPVLAVLSVGASAEALNATLGQAVVAKSMWRRFGLDVLLVVVLGFGAWLLVPRWGALGLSVAYLLAYTVVAVVLLRHTHYQMSAGIADEGARACLED